MKKQLFLLLLMLSAGVHADWCSSIGCNGSHPQWGATPSPSCMAACEGASGPPSGLPALPSFPGMPGAQGYHGGSHK